MSALLAVPFVIVAATVAAWLFWLNRRFPETRWDWAGFDPKNVKLPAHLSFGAATSAHQVEGHMPENNWTVFERATDPKGNPRIKNGERSGAACLHYHRFQEDLDRVVELGLDAYRFSVEWARIEPRPGDIDEAELAHYHEVVNACLERGLTPMVTLHHFTHPVWFEELGGFERLENLDHFVRFAKRVFEELSPKVSFWVTINEPNVFVVQGYLFGIFPPGVSSVSRAARTLWGMMQAHTRAYHALKAMPHGSKASIGLVTSIFQLDPWNRLSPLDWAAALVGNRFFNDAILDYLRTGVFEVGARGWRRLVREDPLGRHSGEFVGLNYYSHVHVTIGPKSPYLTPRHRPDEVMTDMPYASYPEGFYRALIDTARVGLPIYVTENGIADARDDRRADFIARYLHALERAIADGVDVRGYYYWSLLDNFEWSEGYGMRFGLFEVDYGTQQRRLRAGSRAYVEAVARAKANQ
ncbi:MAG: glycoside hydrolase family 1 protein [Deltaproteobacteria bacterium]|nr:glycoside hydrolase family 1 protein [Deltaproteobacteria bacterium]